MRVEILRGDITEIVADAIVNAANNALWMGGGVAGAIKRRGGAEIEKEAVSKGPIPVGEAVVTGAGRLKARYVIHAAGMGTDLKTSENYIRMATRNALKRAEELKLESVAFPAIGTGVGGFPYKRAARAMLEEILNFEGEHPKKVIMVLYTEEVYRAFSEVFEEIS